MSRESLDKELTDLLGPAAAAALARWARIMRLELGCDRVLLNGRSGATVVSVFEWQADGSARKLILKHEFVDDDAIDMAEYTRQSAALGDAPSVFAGSRLARLAHEPVSVGDGTWITFQEIANGGPERYDVMTSLLTGNAVHTKGELAALCAMIVQSVLADWAQKPMLERMPASEFVRRHLADRATPGKRLHNLARGWTQARIHLPGEPAELINPFAFVFDPSPALNVSVPAILGRAHGDLHTENILVREDLQAFRLIDLPRYQADAPLTRDPIHLVLSVINRTMATLADEELESLLGALTGTAEAQPPWIAEIIDSTRAAALRWIGQAGLAEEWRLLTPLSTLANALIFAARPSTTEAGREWFVRLAARSAQAFANSLAARGVQSTTSVTGESHDNGAGLGELCRDLAVKRKRARDRGRGDDLERLVTKAKLGQDITQAYTALMASIGYAGHRGHLPGLDGGSPVVTENFSCPLATPCARQEGRGPNGETPVCFVQYGEMSLSVGNRP